MKRLTAAGIVAALFAWNASAEEAGPEMPKPDKEHAWLQQIVGEWETEVEIFAEPGQPSTKSKGTESSRMVGGFWAMSEIRGDAMGTAFTGILTVGYDPEKKTYVGTWVDSMTSHMWTYTGSVDEKGKMLTLNTEGPSPMDPSKSCKFQESIEIKDKDHKTFVSKFEKDGDWVTMMKVEYTRKK